MSKLDELLLHRVSLTSSLTGEAAKELFALRADNERLLLQQAEANKLIQEISEIPYTQAEMLERVHANNKDIYGAMIGTAKGIGDRIKKRVTAYLSTVRGEG